MQVPDLIVIGAGAAGLMCVITAANRIGVYRVLERSAKCPVLAEGVNFYVCQVRVVIHGGALLSTHPQP
jgi:ribulose 1,5-bisphosphate synthetase/thiazole synthase